HHRRSHHSDAASQSANGRASRRRAATGRGSGRPIARNPLFLAGKLLRTGPTPGRAGNKNELAGRTPPHDLELVHTKTRRRQSLGLCRRAGLGEIIVGGPCDRLPFTASPLHRVTVTKLPSPAGNSPAPSIA